MSAPFQSQPYLISPYTRSQKAVLLGISALWLYGLVSFYFWWFDPDHVVTSERFWLVTAALGWDTLIPAYFVFFLLRARVPNPDCDPPSGARVAMVVTKVPSESLALVQQTLEGMLGQAYPHDTWLADEDPDEETIAWCESRGVRISTRKGVADYHRDVWPRRKRCKEGNLAYFYDEYGYDSYDIVVQMDADHIPGPEYLEHMLRPFRDLAVGYVSAPSICGRNSTSSWAARTRLYVEAHLHGVQQMGHSNGFAPLCFGSHYAVRTVALKSIGGLGPELAEDHSTSLLMNAGGWRGVHAGSAIANGYGPDTFEAFAVQEFQWARSLTTILLMHTPRAIGTLPTRLKAQFLFSQLWYILFSFSMLIFLLLPAGAIATGSAYVNVIYLEFFWRSALFVAPLIAMNVYLTMLGLGRPSWAKPISWEAALFLFIRWPWSLLGCVIAVWDRLSGRAVEFKITPKPGANSDGGTPFRFCLPYLLFSLFAVLPVLTTAHPGEASGYVVFSLMNATIYAVAFALVAVGDRKPLVSRIRRSSDDEVKCV